MKEINILNFKTPNSLDSTKLYIGDGENENRSTGDHNITELIKQLGSLLTAEKWKVFQGKRNENPKEFIDQFLQYEDQWSSEKLLKIVKTKLEFRALKWFEAKEGFEINTYEEFKTEFMNEYVQNVDLEEKEQVFWSLILTGPKYHDVISYLYELMTVSGREERKIGTVKNKIDEYIWDEYLKDKLAEYYSWADILNFCRRYEKKINAGIKKKITFNQQQCEFNDQKKNSHLDKSFKKKSDKKIITISANIEFSGDNRPRVLLENDELKINTLLDTGATDTIIRNDIVKKLKLKVKDNISEVKGLVGKSKIIGETEFLIMDQQQILHKIKGYVMKEIEEELILGIDEIKKINLIGYIDSSLGHKEQKPDKVVLSMNRVEVDCWNDQSYLEEVNLSKELSQEQREQALSIIKKYERIFLSSNTVNSLDMQHAIELVNMPERYMCIKYKRSPEEHLFIKNEVENFLEKGLIEESNSNFISPVVIVRKEGKSPRFCIDYRKLNNITVKMDYPIPRIDETLDMLTGAKVFTTLDMESGYHQVYIKEEDREKTAFYTREGIYHWKRMPFGLINAPFTFQKIMNRAFREFLYKFVVIYLDDILIFSNTVKQHLEHLRIIFDIVEKTGFKLNTKKCHILEKKIQFLGYEIENGKMTIPLKQKTKILDFMEPKNRKEIRSFMGFTSFFSRFISNYAIKMVPLYDCLKGGKGEKFIFTKEAKEMFQIIKQEILESVALALPDFNKQFVIYTDASDQAMGAALVQIEEKEIRPIIFISKRFSAAEVNYTVTEKECLAIVWAIKKLRIYLANEFIVKTDHKSLKWLLKLKEATGRLMRWILTLQEYKFKIEFIEGKENILADTLSRKAVQVLSQNITKRSGLTQEEKKDLLFRSHFECGHGGVEATYVIALRHQSWVGMYNDVKNTIKNCEVCNKFNRGPSRLQKFRIELANPLDKIGIDIVGPLPRTENGNKYIIVATDYITRWTEAQAVKSKTASNVAIFLLNKVFTQHGSPKEIISDQGKEFVNKVVENVCKLMNSKRSTTSAFNPKCNGATERVNQTLVGKLAKFVNGNWNEWDEYLPYALFAYRISPRSTTKKSPFELLYGRRPNLLVTESKLPVIEEENYLIFERLKSARELWLKEEREMRNQEIGKLRKDNLVEDLKKGDLVRKRKTLFERHNKLDTKFEGIYEIIEVLKKGCYIIKSLDGKKFKINRKDISLIEESDPAEWILSEKGSVSQGDSPCVLRISCVPEH